MPSEKFLEKVSSSSSYYRSTRLTVFMVLSIALNVVLILLMLINFPYDAIIELKILIGVLIGAAALDIVLCLFILKLKRWAFHFYIVLNIITGIIRIIAFFDFFSVIFRAVLLYFIFKKDLEYFD